MSNKKQFEPNDKRQFGSLQVFKNLIIFAHDNGNGKSGAFIDADPEEMRRMIVQVFKNRPELRELMRQCVTEASSGIIIPIVSS